MARLATTRWTLILRAASRNDAEARVALALLCETYWYPVYAYFRRLGAAPADAEDLTQGYFTRFLEADVVRGLRPEKGRFRSFLLASARNFFHNQRDREQALKRGGGRRLVSLDAAVAEERLRALPQDPVTPETVFERSWAETVVARVHERLEQEAARRGIRERLLRLRPFLTGAARGESLAGIAQEWGERPGAVRVALHRLRQRFARLLREEVSRTVGRLADVDDECRHLFAVLDA